jgi:peptidoglycan hydrolase CwlO-like protein
MPQGSSSGGDPPAARWLNKYLALTIFVTSVVSTLITGLVIATLTWSNASHTIDEHDKLLSDVKKQQLDTRTDMVNVDRRLNEGATNLNNSERQQDQRSAELAQKIAVLEAQLKLFGDRTVAPPTKGLP